MIIARRRWILSAALLAAVAACPLAQAAPVTFADAVLANSPYAYYRLGEATGSTAADASVNSRDATYIGAVALGQAGYDTGDTAAAFTTSSSDYVSLTDMADFGTHLNSFSIELIFKTTTESGGNSTLFGSINDGSGHTAVLLAMNANAAGSKAVDSQRLFVRSENGHQFSAAFINADLNNGEYHHLIVTYTAGGLPTIYVDGIAQTVTIGDNAISAGDSFVAFDNTPALAAINSRGTIGGAIEATIDEAAFYTHVLTATDAASHHNALIPEPATLALLGLGGLLLAPGARRRSA